MATCLFLRLGMGISFKTYESAKPGGSKIGWTSLRGGPTRKLLNGIGDEILNSTDVFSPQVDCFSYHHHHPPSQRNFT